ncbi:hypothetical protein ACOTTU_10860 [Roseobacter sp. EG26]|uniref:hypothetical protein n=1 Tax=Roseobacter sp. EG26 TaxID=3412477 RepID=UPI003CE530BD
MPARKYTEAERNTVAELREQGLALSAISARTGMTLSSVAYTCLLKAVDSPQTAGKLPVYNGAMVMKRGKHTVRRFTPKEDRKIIEMELSGHRVSEIAAALGRKSNSVKGRMMTLARRQERQLNGAQPVQKSA